jgi:hypothetical protein
MKHWLMAAALVCFCNVVAKAQTPIVDPCDAPATPSDWLACQKGYAGIGHLISGDKSNWATTSWDLFQVGAAGLNVAKPSNTLDWVDFGPMLATANLRAPRYGACIVVHGGNIWNGIKLSSKVASHVSTTKLPAFAVSYCLLLPHDPQGDLSINKMRPWSRDGMLIFNYGFGGGS